MRFFVAFDDAIILVHDAVVVVLLDDVAVAVGIHVYLDDVAVVVILDDVAAAVRIVFKRMLLMWAFFFTCKTLLKMFVDR